EGSEDLSLIKSFCAFGAFLWLEVEPELPLNQPSTRIVCPRYRDITVRGAGLSERRRGRTDAADRCVRIAEEKVRPVERIQERNATLEIYLLRQAKLFEHVEIKTRRHWPMENNAIAKDARCQRWSNVRRVWIQRSTRPTRESCNRVVDYVLWQPVNDATRVFADLHYLLQVLLRHVVKDHPGIKLVDCRATTTRKQSRGPGLDSRDTANLPVAHNLPND